MTKLVSSKELTPKHHRMITALVLEGLTQKEVCDRYDISETRLSILRKDRTWKKEEGKLIGQFRANCFSRIQQLAPEAIEALAETIKPYRDDGTPNDSKSRIAASKEILNRAGLKEPQDKEEGGTTIQLYAPGWATESGKGEIIEVDVGKTD